MLHLALFLACPRALLAPRGDSQRLIASDGGKIRLIDTQGDKVHVEVEVDTKTFLGVLKGSKVETVGAE